MRARSVFAEEDDLVQPRAGGVASERAADELIARQGGEGIDMQRRVGRAVRPARVATAPEPIVQAPAGLWDLRADAVCTEAARYLFSSMIRAVGTVPASRAAGRAREP